MAYLQSELTENYCGLTDPNGTPVTSNPCPTFEPPPDDFAPPQAPKGTELPLTPKFKGNLTARYEFNVGAFDAHVQGSVVYQGERQSDLRLVEREILGAMPSYTITDFTGGFGNNSWQLELFILNAFDERAELYKFAQCAETICGVGQTYSVTNPPRTVGLKFSQKF
jgi:outer membrane receptor protein involved in Fe transport